MKEGAMVNLHLTTRRLATPVYGLLVLLILTLTILHVGGPAQGAGTLVDVKNNPPGVLTPALQAKLDVFKQRGLDYSDALAFWPMGDGDGLLQRTFGHLGDENPWLLASAAIDTQWAKESRFKGQYAIQFSPPLSYMNGGGRLLLQGNLQHTIAAWCRPAWFQGGGMIFFEGGSVNGRGLFVKAVEGKGSANTILTQDSKSETLESKPVDLPGGWMHVVSVYNGPAGTQAIYINGTKVAEQPTAFKTFVAPGRGWNIGGGDPGSGMGGQFNGVIDEVVIWTRAMSDQEIAQLYEKGKPDAGTEVKPVTRPPLAQLTATELPSIDDIAYHFDFNRTLEPQIVSGQIAGQTQAQLIRDCEAQINQTTVKANEPRYQPGRFGDGLYLGDTNANMPKGEALHYVLPHPIPEKEGAIALWFKPDWEWGTGIHQLFYAQYCMLAAGVEGPRIYGYTGGNETNGNLIAFASPWEWPKQMQTQADTWHLLVVSWYKDGTAQFFLDGLAGERYYAPLRSFGRDLWLGFPGWQAGTDRDPGTNRPDAVLDELTIFQRGLSPAQVLTLYKLDRPYLSAVQGIQNQVQRTAWKRGEKLTWAFKCFTPGKFTAILTQDNSTWPLYSADVKTDDTVSIPCDSTTLRPGSYTLVAALQPARGAAFQQKVDVIINEDKEPPIVFGLLSFARDDADRDRIAQAGFYHVGQQATSDVSVLDNFYRRGLHYSPILNAELASRILTDNNVPKEQWQQLFMKPGAAPEYFTSQETLPQPFSPMVQNTLRRMVDDLVSPMKGHPAFRYITMHDELYQQVDVSPSALDYFKQQTGIAQQPDFKPVPNGSILPDDDPRVKWMETFGQPNSWTNMNIGMVDKVVTDELHKVAPGAKTWAQPSSNMGMADHEVIEIYPYLIESPTARFTDGKPELLVDPQMDIANALQRVTPLKPQWPLLGWLNMPGAPEFNQSLQVMIEVCLAKGAKGVLVAPDTWVRNRPDMITTVRSLVDFSKRYGPMLNQLRHTGLGRVAVLWDPYNSLSSPNLVAGNNIWLTLPTLRANSIPTEVVNAQQVLAGTLDNYDALLLVNHTVTTQSLQNKIMAFTQRGGAVFCDDVSPMAPALLPPGTVRLPWQPNQNFGDPVALHDALMKMFTPVLKSWPVRTDSVKLAPYYAVGTGCQVYFVINTDLYNAQQGEVSAEGQPGVVYDLMAGQQVKTQVKEGRLTWPTQIEKGGWRIYMRRAAPVDKVALTTSARGMHVTVSALVSATDKKPAANVPLEVRVFDTTGKLTPYGSCISTDEKGTAVAMFDVGALTDRQGAWRVEVTELLSGQQAKASVNLNYTSPVISGSAK